MYQDLRTDFPEGLFDLILCRNVAFTYFAGPLQENTLHRMVERLSPGGYLMIGTHEGLPQDGTELLPLDVAPQIFVKGASQR